MILRQYFRLAPVLIGLALTPASAFASNALELADVENFTYGCVPNQNNGLRFEFSPVRRLSSASRSVGQWSFEFRTEDRRYPDNRISLPEHGALRLDLVMQLDQSESDSGESYLWNVIVAPTVTGWTFGGHWPTKGSIIEEPRLAAKRESLIHMMKLSSLDRQPVHSKILPKDIDSAGTLNKAWENLFGKEIISSLVYPASKGARVDQSGYSLTFYYVPTPAIRLINAEGYKWPSFKHVDKAGKVFGFVLSPQGKCLAWNSIEVVGK